jgi:hypothetical protein
MLRSIFGLIQAQQAAPPAVLAGTPQVVPPQQLAASASFDVAAISLWVMKVSQAIPWGSLTQALSERA